VAALVGQTATCDDGCGRPPGVKDGPEVQGQPKDDGQGQWNLEQAKVECFAVFSVDVLAKKKKGHGCEKDGEERSCRPPYADAKRDLAPNFAKEGYRPNTAGGLDGKGDDQIFSHASMKT